MALPGNQFVPAVPVLPGRLLLQTSAVRGPVLLLRPERLLLQAAAVRGAILLLRLRRLLCEADAVHLAVLHSARAQTCGPPCGAGPCYVKPCVSTAAADTPFRADRKIMPRE